VDEEEAALEARLGPSSTSSNNESIVGRSSETGAGGGGRVRLRGCNGVGFTRTGCKPGSGFLPEETGVALDEELEGSKASSASGGRGDGGVT
jgi:hypothetical protein